MIDFSISSGQLMLIWSFAGAVCCLPFFTKNRWQHFVIVPIIFLAIFLSFETNHNFIGKPLYDRPPNRFVYQFHSVVYEKGDRWIILWAIKNVHAYAWFVFGACIEKLYRMPIFISLIKI